MLCLFWRPPSYLLQLPLKLSRFLSLTSVHIGPPLFNLTIAQFASNISRGLPHADIGESTHAHSFAAHTPSLAYTHSLSPSPSPSHAPPHTHAQAADNIHRHRKYSILCAGTVKYSIHFVFTPQTSTNAWRQRQLHPDGSMYAAHSVF